jgi:acetyl esterase
MLDQRWNAFLLAAHDSGSPPVHSLPPALARHRHIDSALTVSASPEQVREVHERLVPGTGPEVPVRIYLPLRRTVRGTVLYFHGGGWEVGTLDTFDGVCRALANRCGMAVVSVDYRLAPEHGYPAAVEDGMAVTRWVSAGAAAPLLDAGPLVVAGESAGGNLAAVLTIRARQLTSVDIAAQVLLYPIVDVTMSAESYRTYGAGHHLTAVDMAWYWRMYLGEGDRNPDEGFSPLHAQDLSRSPPAFVLTAECDPLRDEGEEYANRLRKAGSTVRAYRAPGMIHGFLRLSAICPEVADTTVDMVGQFIRSMLKER